MSVYIKGMEMPKNCCGCVLGDAADGYYCKITGNGYNWGNPNRPSSCPLIPVPDHGRLIDADAFIKDECNNCDGACEALPCDCLNCKSNCRCEFIVDLADAPTIIPADPDKEVEE